MTAAVRIKRGTRAQLNAAAVAGQLAAGEPYLITDESRFAVGVSATAFQAMALASEAGPAVGATAPTSPAVGALWVDTSGGVI